MPLPLEVGINADDVDHSHALVESVEGDGDEPDRPTVHDCNEGISLIAHATGCHLVSLSRLPVGLQAKEEGVAENLAQRREDRIPCAKRELHDRVEVALLELSDLDYVSHRPDETLPGP